MDTTPATMANVGRFIWKFADYLEQHGINPYRIARHGKDDAETQTIYRLARKGQQIKRLDLNSLALIIEAVKRETGVTLTPNDLLEFVDDDAKPERLHKQIKD